MNRFLSFISGILMGALVGAALALLFAPASGEELRLQLQERTAQVQAQVKQAAAERRSELEQQLSALRAPKSSTGSVELPE